jgi:hypothetical protein
MTADPLPSLAALPETPRASRLARFPWPLLLLITILSFLIADRYRYLTHFGFVYTDGDQTTFWYQANDIAHGIFREPCLYGQAYNPPVEAWVAAPLLWFNIPPYIALPLATVTLALLPFLVLAAISYRRRHRWAASIILLIPLTLPIEYTVVSSLPRGFINGLAVATPTLALWLFYRSRKTFFFAAFFAVAALTVNPNCSIILLAAGVFALLTHYRSRLFYIFSFFGAVAALPAPLLIQLFYHYHPECDAYRPKVTNQFTWELLKSSLFIPNRRVLTLDHLELNLFFADFVPVLQKGWIILIILPALVILQLLVFRIKAAVAVLLASTFAILCLGIERLHSADDNVFYSGSRMYLALPVLFAVALLWFDDGLGERFKKKLRFIPPTVRAVLILSLACFACCRHVERLDPPSPYVTQAYLPPVEDIKRLTTDTLTVADACRKYNASLVLVCISPYTCFNDAAPVLSHQAFETLYPNFERRTFRVADERTHLHTAVLVYIPGFFEMGVALRKFPHAKVVSHSPELLLVPIDPPGKPGLDIATALGLLYRPKL